MGTRIASLSQSIKWALTWVFLVHLLTVNNLLPILLVAWFRSSCNFNYYKTWVLRCIFLCISFVPFSFICECLWEIFFLWKTFCNPLKWINKFYQVLKILSLKHGFKILTSIKNENGSLKHSPSASNVFSSIFLGFIAWFILWVRYGTQVGKYLIQVK